MASTAHSPSGARPSSVAREDPARTRERLRSLIRRLEARTPRRRVESPRPPDVRPEPVEAVFPHAIRRQTAQGSLVYMEQPYPLDHQVGDQPLSHLLHVSPRTLSFLSPGEETEGATVDDLLFLDIETTGLGGAGAIAFLVATARLERHSGPDAFVLRQYLATSPPEEAAVMAALIEDCGLRDHDPVLVTYNGRAFDAPMLDERATMHRMRAGFDALRHLDLLSPVRTGLRGVMASCRLATVESDLLRLTRPSTEVDGGEVPAHYFRYLRSGDARWLAPLVEHNAQDVVSLGALAGRFAALFEDAAPPSTLDAVALGRLHAARGAYEPAVRFLERAAAELPPSSARDDVLLRLARLHRRAGRRDLAVPLWRELADTPHGPRLDPLVEIAKHLEHDCRDFTAAIEVVDEALRTLERLASFDGRESERRRGDLLTRRDRLVRRLARAARG